MMDLLGKLVDPVSNILDKVIEDKDQKARLAHEISTMAERHAQELARGQIEINKEEAKKRNNPKKIKIIRKVMLVDRNY